MDPINQFLTCGFTTLSRIDTIFLSLLLLLLLTSIIYNRYFHPLSPFPGPPIAAIWSGWRARKFYYNLDDQEYLHERYGPLVRTSPNMLSIADPKYIKEILTHTDCATWWLPFSREGSINVFSASPTGLHHDRQRRIAPVYSMSTARDREEMMDEVVSQWIIRLREEFGKGGRGCDFTQWCEYFMVDLIGLATFGIDARCVRSGSDKQGHSRGLEDGLILTGMLFRLPSVYPIITSNPTLRAFRQKAAAIVEVAWKSREEAEAQGKEWHLDPKGPLKGVTMLEKAMSTKVPDGTRLTQEEVLLESLFPFIAGMGSTSFAISSAIMNLIVHPRALQTLRSELSTYYSYEPLTHIPSWSDIMDPISGLTYLHAALRESLRLYPAFPIPFPRMVSENGLTVTHNDRPYTIPRGCEVGTNPTVLNRNKRVFGEDAHFFRPERWIEASEEQLRVMKTTDFEWGAGSRVCLGKAQAQVAIGKAVVMFVRNFDFKLKDPAKPWNLVTMGVRHATDFWIELVARVE